MKVDSPTEDKIIVELSPEDMCELDITYETMDYSTVETRRVVWTLLDRAGKQLNRDIDPTEKMLIEAIPRGDGGCLICFTLFEAAGHFSLSPLVKKQTAYTTFEFVCADSLLEAAAHYRGECDVDSELYESDGKYRLIFSSQPSKSRLRLYFSEFCENVWDSPHKAAQTREHWRTVCDRNALARIAGKQIL